MDFILSCLQLLLDGWPILTQKNIFQSQKRPGLYRQLKTHIQRCNCGELFACDLCDVGAESAPRGWNRVKASETLGAIVVAPVAPAVMCYFNVSYTTWYKSLWQGPYVSYT